MTEDNILNRINSPSDLKKLSTDELYELSDEIREEIMTVVSNNGGHLASNLGVVELTVAIHSVFNTPKDKIVWDVGHQSYTHKILTGRLDELKTIRTENGLSGFPKRNESEYASEITSVDKTQQKVKKELDSCRKDMEQISSTLFNNDSSESVYTVHTTYATQILDFVANFCILGGSVWMILGTITLAGSLKDKNGPTLQTSIWQIIGGTMIVFATYLFRNSSQYPNLLNEVLWIASQFTRVGGALWLAWGVIILAGAIKDKTGPALQSAIWQIVGGIMIVMTSYLFMYVV